MKTASDKSVTAFAPLAPSPEVTILHTHSTRWLPYRKSLFSKLIALDVLPYRKSLFSTLIALDVLPYRKSLFSTLIALDVLPYRKSLFSTLTALDVLPYRKSLFSTLIAIPGKVNYTLKPVMKAERAAEV
jgi:hypothetical protein